MKKQEETEKLAVKNTPKQAQTLIDADPEQQEQPSIASDTEGASPQETSENMAENADQQAVNFAELPDSSPAAGGPANQGAAFRKLDQDAASIGARDISGLNENDFSSAINGEIDQELSVQRPDPLLLFAQEAAPSPSGPGPIISLPAPAPPPQSGIGPSIPSQGTAPQQPPAPISKPLLFTAFADAVDFNTIAAGQYNVNSFYNADSGNDVVYLPENALISSVLGYSLTMGFNAGIGDDVVYGGALNDSIYGTHGNDILYGNAGNDMLRGGLDQDYLHGGAGFADTLFGEEGGDTLVDSDGVFEAHGGDGDDKIGISFAAAWDNDNKPNNAPVSDYSISGGYGDDKIDIALNNVKFTIKLYADEALANAAFDGDDKVALSGSYKNSVVYLNGGDDHFSGGIGTDSVFGGLGDDTLHGGAGKDTLRGEGGNDTLYGGMDNDTLTGGAGHDKLFGDDSADTLQGGAGDDILHGGKDADTMTGNAGRDIFAWKNGDINAVDVINDFKTGQDKLDISDLLAGVLTPSNNIADFVQFLDDGANTYLHVNLGGPSHDMGVNIALLKGVSFALGEVKYTDLIAV